MIASDGVTAPGASAKETLPRGEPGAGQWPLGSLCGTRQRLRALDLPTLGRYPTG